MTATIRRLNRRLTGQLLVSHRLRGRTSRQPRAGLDWPVVRARFATADAAIAASAEAAPEMLERSWARRAERLARVPEEIEAGEHLWLVVTRIGRELYGLDALHVAGIRPAGHITPVPRAPAWVAGMVNVRGRVLSTVDLQRFFDLAPAESAPDEAGCLVVVEAPGMELALLVDDVLGVEAVPLARLQEAAGVLRGLPPEYVRGVAEYGAREPRALLDVLDLRAILADPRLVVDEATV
jgi:purine-binding chemotaxis protein CheW